MPDSLSTISNSMRIGRRPREADRRFATYFSLTATGGLAAAGRAVPARSQRRFFLDAVGEFSCEGSLIHLSLISTHVLSAYAHMRART